MSWLLRSSSSNTVVYVVSWLLRSACRHLSVSGLQSVIGCASYDTCTTANERCCCVVQRQQLRNRAVPVWFASSTKMLEINAILCNDKGGEGRRGLSCPKTQHEDASIHLKWKRKGKKGSGPPFSLARTPALTYHKKLPTDATTYRSCYASGTPSPAVARVHSREPCRIGAQKNCANDHMVQFLIARSFSCRRPLS